MIDVKFISYDGKFPNLCCGTLTLEIDGKTVTFGDECGEDHPGFWLHAGRIDAPEDWKLAEYELPEHLRPYGQRLINLFNENVEPGCCGGCF